MNQFKQKNQKTKPCYGFLTQASQVFIDQCFLFASKKEFATLLSIIVTT